MLVRNIATIILYNAGDEIRMKYKIDDIYDKKNGLITFIAFRSKYINQNNIKVAESVSTLVIR